MKAVSSECKKANLEGICPSVNPCSSAIPQLRAHRAPAPGTYVGHRGKRAVCVAGGQSKLPWEPTC